MRLPSAIGAVVDGVPTTFHTPLSGQISPVVAVVPIGALAIMTPLFEDAAARRSRAAWCDAARLFSDGGSGLWLRPSST